MNSETTIALDICSQLQSEISSTVAQALGVDTELCGGSTRVDYIQVLFGESDSEQLEASSVVSYFIGCLFGRWDIRYATGERPAPELPDPFDPLPVCPAGMLQNAAGLPAIPADVPADYPLRISWPGILVDDPGHDEDIESRVKEVLAVLWPYRSDAIAQEAAELLRVRALRDFFRKPSGFFADHLKRYSKGRRQAPIYWAISTASGSYTIWLYYHRFKRDTLSLALEHYAKPKLRHEQSKLDHLRGETGHNPTRIQREAIESQESLVHELSSFVEELARVAPLWNPDLNDGAIINYAPLWRITGHTPWRRNIKGCWDSLCAGEYDWSHLAMHLWPERVVPKCAADRSLAIAHGLEDVFWLAETDGKWKPRSAPTRPVDELVLERSSLAVKAALKGVLEAPSLIAGTTRARRGRTHA